jgi:hypothetical protein
MKMMKYTAMILSYFNSEIDFISASSDLVDIGKMILQKLFTSILRLHLKKLEDVEFNRTRGVQTCVKSNLETSGLVHGNWLVAVMNIFPSKLRN